MKNGSRRYPELGPARRLLVAAFALVLATAGIAFAFRSFRSDTIPAADESPSAQPSPIPPLTGEPRIIAEIPLLEAGEDDVVGGIAVSGGSAWVGVQRGGSGSVVRIDLATNEVVAEIPMQETPWRKRMAATDDAVWVASSGVLERIDPATNTVVASVELPNRSISAITADEDAVWVVAIGNDGGQPAGMLIRIDTATNEIIAEIPLGPEVAGYEDEVMVGAGSVWVLGVRWFEEQDAEYGSDLIRVDPVSNAIATRIPVGGFHMVMGTNEVWVRLPADGVFDGPSERWLWTRVDVRENEPSEPFEFEADGLKIVTPEALWSVGYDDQENVRVTRFDPETLEVVVRSEPIRSYFTDAVLDPASSTVWVSAVYSVVRVDIADEGAPSPATAPPALTQGTAQHDPEGGVFILSPPDWSFLVDPSGPYEPEMLFAIASYAIQAGGECAPTQALDALPADGALAWVLEYHGTKGNDFPPRPDRFSLDRSTLANYECSGSHPTYFFRFQDEGRYFQVQVALGEQTRDELRDEMLASLSSPVVDRCPPAEPPALVSEYGTLSSDQGIPGTQITLSGTTGRDENWFWAPLDKVEVWWSREFIGVPEETSDKHLLASVDPGQQCSFSVTLRVPDAPAGRYVITVLGYWDEGYPAASGFGLMGERPFTVGE